MCVCMHLLCISTNSQDYVFLLLLSYNSINITRKQTFLLTLLKIIRASSQVRQDI